MNIKLILSTITGLGTVGGVATGFYYVFINGSTESKHISEWLISNGRTMLLESDSEWNSNWATFKVDFPLTNPPKQKWNIDNWADSFATSGLIELKKLCTANANEKTNSASGDLYNQVKKYCTKAKVSSP